MSSETDATRLSEIGARCDKATEGPWLLREMDQNQICSAVVGPDGIDIIRFSDGDDAGAKRRAAGAFVAHAREDVPWLLEQLGKADGEVPASESKLVHICQLLGVDYTCEEPETCEQVIERLLGRLAAMREALEVLSGWASKAIQALCDVDHMNLRAIGLRFNADARGVLTTDAGKPEADVLSAAARYEDANRQYRELRYDDAWHGHYKETLLEDRAVAAKDLCAAVARIREGSGGALEAPDEGGGE